MSDSQTAIDEHLTSDGVLKNQELVNTQHIKSSDNTTVTEHVPFSFGVPGPGSLRQRPDAYKTNLD
mgnify:CR=1 FL=1